MKVAEYTYDVWGNVLSITGSMADSIGQKNPLRYRGYYYDSETGFFYVSSRYYEPEIGRWINTDGYVSTGQGVLGYNMFAYCGNNPVNRKDPSGQFWITALIVTAVVAVCTVALSGCSSIPSSPADYIQDNSTNQNCYSNAFGLPGSADPGDYSISDNDSDYMFKDKNMYTTQEITEFVERDMNALEKSVRVVDSPSDKLANEYIVAMKTSTIIHPRGIADYHFAIQLSDGTWADKPGIYPSRWNMIDGNAIAWDQGNIQNYYNTETVYFAVGK